MNFIHTPTKKRSFLHAVKWSYLSTWGEKGFTALFTFFLAAILGPRDFGIVSIAVVYVLFLQMILDQGLAVALIQKAELAREHLNAVFWMNIGLGLFLVGVSTIVGKWWAAVNHAPQAAAIISVLSLCVPIEALSIVQKSLLSREMDFKSLAVRSNASVFVGGVVGVLMACTGYGVWSLVGQQITRDIASVLLLWRLSSWRPRWEFSWMHFRSLLGFSVSTFLAQLGIFADTYASSIVLGLFFGPIAVGLYRLADRAMTTLLASATSSIQSVSLPEFSRFQNDPKQLRNSVLACIRLSSTVTLPALAGLAAVSTPLMAVIGRKWILAAGVLKILCVLGACLVFAYFTGPLLQALGKVKLAAILEWGRTMIGIALLVAAGIAVRNDSVELQIMGIAVARFLVGGLIVMPIFLFYLVRVTSISFLDLTSCIAPSLVSSAATVVAVLLLGSTGWLEARSPVFVLAAEVLFGGSIGLTVLLGMDAHLRGAFANAIRRSVGLRIVAKETV